MTECDVCEIIPNIEPQFTLIDGEHWVANLRNDDQTLLGTSFITARRHIPELDMVDVAGEREFIVIRNSLIKAIRGTFSPITFNISCLKNDAFKPAPDVIPPETSHVHWHVKPRYNSVGMKVNGETFNDPMPGRYLEPSRYMRHRPTNETAQKIALLIRDHISN
jgi:diadenosine tetraphosphate (Ap4A) HIT family hydrolase